MPPTVAPQRSILWFRKGLRLHDNPALLRAIQGASHLYPIFVLDPWFLKPEVVGVNRVNFLLQSLTGMSNAFALHYQCCFIYTNFLSQPVTNFTSFSLNSVVQISEAAYRRGARTC